MSDCVVGRDGQDRRGEGEGEIVNVWGRDEKCETKEKMVNAIEIWNSLKPVLTPPVYTVLQKRVEKIHNKNYIHLCQLVIIFAHLCQ